jgi:MFS family permease
MTAAELKATLSLSTVMALRMIGLFMVLPVFTLYAKQLAGATPTLIGIAIGIYGLTQAILQIPFGWLSDRFGRRPLILLGLLLFAIGSLLACFAPSIYWMIIGRALQGVGAIGSTILALLADLTREEQRTKAMAIAGISIGFSFMLAMLLGPLLAQWLAVNNLFLLAVLCAGIAIVILYTCVPVPTHAETARFNISEEKSLSVLKLFLQPTLTRLNSGIFILHAIFTASFIVIPISFYQFTGLPATRQWLLYVPALLLAAIISLICIGRAERKKQNKFYFLGSILIIILGEIILWVFADHLFSAALGLCCFFIGFSLLEAFLPSLVSRSAPRAQKGTALGLYSCAQFSGIFMGGALGGWLYGQFSFTGVYIFCIVLALLWFILAVSMPRLS